MRRIHWYPANHESVLFLDTCALHRYQDFAPKSILNCNSAQTAAKFVAEIYIIYHAQNVTLSRN